MCFKKSAWLGLGLTLLCTITHAAPNVVTTLKPLHSLVSQVTLGVSEPTLLVKQGSPHAYQLKPSDVRTLHNADLLVWIGEDMETFVPDILRKVDDDLHQIAWSQLDGLERLTTRQGGLWRDDDHHNRHYPHVNEQESHDLNNGTIHHDTHTDELDHAYEHRHEHENEQDHRHEHDDEQDQKQPHHTDEERIGHHAHPHGEYDPHIWLSTNNAALLLTAVTEELAHIDPHSEAIYRQNLANALAKLNALENDLAMSATTIKDKPYMVFHDAYQYFEHQFDLHSVGAIRVSPEHEPGAARIGELSQLMHDNAIKCLFTEPQFPVKMASKLVKDTAVKLGTLDPIGADIESGPQAYETLMRQLMASLQDCLDED